MSVQNQNRNVFEKAVASLSGVPHACACPHCGQPAGDDDEPVLKRGAIVVAFDPPTVWWRGCHVPLSPTEAATYAFIARRGRALVTEIDEFLDSIGAKRATRPLVLGYIRRKMVAMGACEPFQRLGIYAVRLQVDPDERGVTSPVIGLKQPRYARFSPPPNAR
ncbi:hypothetical protein FPZ24_02095 [Sphingomonas panacisoli]|uniref:Uncharacterized protein n=1 Tax=Sphingomonas panacisoli TaxID=1813879 RepID=A0A5B8LFB6_9SPHN|nr:hypothetical protein [Sphingomonas panacisoli]QDZ06414.1 hypothetical protein FPZ24_02095 [Sphingomonas panacisoli]